MPTGRRPLRSKSSHSLADFSRAVSPSRPHLSRVCSLVTRQLRSDNFPLRSGRRLRHLSGSDDGARRCEENFLPLECYSGPSWPSGSTPSAASLPVRPKVTTSRSEATNGSSLAVKDLKVTEACRS
ncbi:hypothetical protein MA16_Dca023863 [Dendrobium catenatum]|uniref:Uncharacterized protein n=1 Tax=Dendrobium catenatum TaxID=906689 RepID=A0A2I0XFN2_9ASPA|nr:hypothetical protein MA16_Dca023863 [Dendrobium catenatum]